MAGNSPRGLFPAAEDAFHPHADKVVQRLVDPANATRLNINAARKAAINAKWTTYDIAYGKGGPQAEDTRTPIDVTNRVTARADLEAELRRAFDNIPADNLTPDDRAIFNLKLPNPRTSIGAPTTNPIVNGITIDQRLLQGVSFADSATPNSKARPAGVAFCQMWVAIVPVGTPAPPADPKNYRFLGTASSTPFLATFDAADGGKMAWHILRWANAKGETGSWSPPEGAIIQP